jgi:hypothetical protein
LKDDKQLTAIYDPYFIAQEKHQNMQQSVYEDLYKKKPELNNIVGDYQGNYKY